MKNAPRYTVGSSYRFAFVGGRTEDATYLGTRAGLLRFALPGGFIWTGYTAPVSA